MEGKPAKENQGEHKGGEEEGSQEVTAFVIRAVPPQNRGLVKHYGHWGENYRWRICHMNVSPRTQAHESERGMQ